MDIVKEKEFIELTAAERAELAELCSTEEEFNQIKSMFAGIGAMNWSNPTPKAETKERLDHLFAQQHSKAAPIWYNAPLAVLIPRGKPVYRQPLVQAAAVGLLIFLAYPLVKSNMMTPENRQVAVLEKEAQSPESPKEVEGKEVNLSSEQDTDLQNEASTYKVEESSKEDLADAIEVPTPAPSVVTRDNTRSVDFVPAEAGSGIATMEDSEVTFNWSDEFASTPGSTHPDGVFIGEKPEIFSVPASRQPEVFDLLTTTF